ncbi:d-galactonate transporter [Caballeronia arvi]|uniref:D-galactonate transporter n=1 Tax=Caballeronia arvi TaxID=1777135 RepID=A0A158KBG0_9BURK|nr:MFS transporter [Caballeronia arvi]SAL77870.1 d-galactonate transporter [Caballeronia arvi]
MTTPIAEAASAAPEHAADAAPTSVRWRIFAVIFVLVMMNLLDRISLSIAMPTIGKEFMLQPAMQGLILSSFFWAYAALQIPGGWLIDRFGPRRILTGSTLLWGLSQTIAGCATGAVSLLATRFALGAAEAPLFPSGAKLNALWLAPGERSRGAVLVDAGGLFGAALGGMAISWLIVSFHSWRTAFVIAGLVTTAMSWLAWRQVRDDPARHPSVNQAEIAHIRQASAVSTANGQGDTAAVPMRVRSWFGLTVGRASWAMVNFGLLTWGPSYLAHARGFDLKQLGMATFFIFIAGALGCLASGFGADALIQRGWPRARVLKSILTFSGLCIFAVFMLLPHVADSVEAVILLSAAAFVVSFGSLYWSMPAILADRSRVGIVGSIMNFAGSLGGMLIPIIVGLILQYVGTYDTVLQFLAGCGVVYMLCTQLIDLKHANG